ncbi:hypothetical protein SAMN04489860_0084 [Paraoerskovia marina]|uniref:Acyl-CoA dehydrogenase n=1 Tax=Paraoerskovia marina TaxID=545619 RepID=A0A1H1LYV1_9CELL|nr:acyl-CoA dehydrogenase family protein [Paraoerskovia marina]SDR79774.1 hypothetical protein SAMN04489860_0084 [Paraoerskovia marina]
MSATRQESPREPDAASGPRWVKVAGDVRVRPVSPRWSEAVADAEPAAALRLARELGREAPLPGAGRTAELWSTLASLSADDVGVARMVEPHLDALAVLAQASEAGIAVDLSAVDADADSTWGVFAAEGPGARLSAATDDAGAWTLTGLKPWCSLAADLSHALVTAWTDDGRRLFAVDLRDARVRAEPGPWVPRGLSQVVSAPVHMDAVPAAPVGAAGWYLERPGFAWGGIGVAACWWGGAVGIARSMAQVLSAREPDQIALAHVGVVDAELHAARVVLADAAVSVDASATAEAAVTARRARAVVARAAQNVLDRTERALGPGPMTTVERYARRCADLRLYLRQHHAERDDASHGRHLLAAGPAPW